MSEAFIDTIISNAIATANSQIAAADDAADELISVSSGVYIAPPTSESGFSVSATEPDIPEGDDSTYSYQAHLNELINRLSGELADFFATYYPLESDAFDEATSWLVNTITNGGTGINASVEAQTWQRDRERIIADTRRVKAGIVTGYAAKNYFFPAGSMLKKMEQADYEGAGNIGIASTSAAKQQYETEIATVRFAVEKAIDSRSMAMNAAADYIRAIALLPDKALEIAELPTDLKAKMMAAASSWYGTKLDRDKIILSSKLAEMGSRDDIYKHRRENATRNSQVEVQAVASAAEVRGRSAQAAFGGLNTVVTSAVNAIG